MSVTGSGPWTVTYTLTAALAFGQTVIIRYGDNSSGGTAVAPSAGQSGNYVFTTQQKSTTGGTLTTVSGTQTVAVNNSADGSGTNGVSPNTAVTSSTDNTLTFTYTAAAGGMNAGEIRIAVPAGWTTPQTGNNTAAGYVTHSGGGGVSVIGSEIVISNLTLAHNATVTVIYGDTQSGTVPGAAAAAPGAGETSTFTTQQKSTSGGTLTSIAVQPTVTVSP